MEESIKRLFLGLEIHAPWPDKLPKGRLIDSNHRHITLAFLGNIPVIPLLSILEKSPKPSVLGSVGSFDSCLALPPHSPHVMAWHMQMQDNSLMTYQNKLSKWLTERGYSMDKREWLPHVTLCRGPFNAAEWKRDFHSLPFYTSSLHLYESVGNLCYNPIWTYPIYPPFEEIAHTADAAFIVRGFTLQDFYQNAFTALCFKAPEILSFFIPVNNFENLDDVIIALNQIVSKADQLIGCSFKAVSFHGEVLSHNNLPSTWEMIVDV